MSRDYYRTQVSSLILEKTIKYLLDHNSNKIIEYSDWSGLSLDLRLTRDIFEKIKSESIQTFDPKARQFQNFESFWETIVSNIHAISLSSEAYKIKQGLRMLLEEDSLSSDTDKSEVLTDSELRVELQWIRQVMQTDNARVLLMEKLKNCMDSRFFYALNVAISKLDDELSCKRVEEPLIMNLRTADDKVLSEHKNTATEVEITATGNDDYLSDLASESLQRQIKALQFLIEKGSQTTLGLAGLLVLHEDPRLKEIVLNGFQLFDQNDISRLLELMHQHPDHLYQQAAEKIRFELKKMES